MPKPAKRVARKASKRTRIVPGRGVLRRRRAVSGSDDPTTMAEFPFGGARLEAVMSAARRSGLLGEKSGRIAGRGSPALVKQAKKQTGIEGDSDLIAFALANVALEDNFAEVFKKSRGKVPADLKLGF